ncbi:MULTISPECIES: hypothetical protein [Cellulosimicrobium]|uniref:DUF7973 domain-containing protein n=1 Tax=Cellulosimicrobium sp. ES-005 TaxID=3163031 RepID=A0AAU8G3R6_9MICO|nr:hypothetical protein [Cellulosimicrobium cellulans]MCO7274454.1 hypothetical protein [Cellulosimicrobium cellulans]
MDIDLFSLLLSLGGGFVGAALGALLAFVFTGLAVVLGVVALAAGGGSGMLDTVAFGPFFGPHVAFAGGVAAAGYAARRGGFDGKDIVTPLASIRRPDVLLVGALFGALGYVVQVAVAATPWFGSHTDTVAVTVFLSGVAARLVFGRTGLLGAVPRTPQGWKRFAPTPENQWIPGQQRFRDNTVLGAFAGLFAAGTTVLLAESFPDLQGSAHVFAFGVSAFSLAFLAVGMPVPVTHHITVVGGLAAATFLPVVGSTFAAVLVGAAFAVVAAWGAELFARLLHIHGDTHIDPPAATIWPTSLLVLGLGSALV